MEQFLRSCVDRYLEVAGDVKLRSTSGGHLNTQGPNTRFPLSGSSKRQGCVSHSTPEAEIVAADVAMRAMGMPALKLLQRILKKSPNFVFYDDNKAMIGVVRSGRNPTMRHLERSHGVLLSAALFPQSYLSPCITCKIHITVIQLALNTCTDNLLSKEAIY